MIEMMSTLPHVRLVVLDLAVLDWLAAEVVVKLDGL